MFKFNDDKSYRKFVNARDVALDKIFRNFRLKNTDLLNETFINVLTQIKMKYSLMQTQRDALKNLEQDLQNIFRQTVFQMTVELNRYLKMGYMLSQAGEAQAIAKVTDKKAVIKLSANAIHNKTIRLDKYIKDVALRFSKLRRDIVQAVEHSIVQGETEAQCLGRVWLKALPKRKALPKKPILKKVKVTEADKPQMKDNPRLFFDVDFDQETWDNLVDEYKKEFIPVDRSPASFTDIKNPYNDLPIREDIDEADKIYDWEVEQTTTHMYVEMVREGQVDAANQNGIDDFVWISILDNRTCEFCCDWRHGLLTSEIEKRLDQEPELADDCDATVPPAHFNCRCTIAPASKDLERVDNSEIEKDFDTWLEGN